MNIGLHLDIDSGQLFPTSVWLGKEARGLCIPHLLLLLVPFQPLELASHAYEQ